MSDNSASSGDRAEVREKRRSQLGEKRFHSETSLVHVAAEAAAAEAEGAGEADPGVFNWPSSSTSQDSLYAPPPHAPHAPHAPRRAPPPPHRARALSQPGPAVQTALAARAQRKRSVEFEGYDATPRSPSADTLFVPGWQQAARDGERAAPPSPPPGRRARAFSQPSLVLQTATATRAQRKRSVAFEGFDSPPRTPSMDTLFMPDWRRERASSTSPAPRRARAFSQPSLAVQTAAAARAQRKRSVGLEVFNESATSAAEAEATRRRRTVSQPGPPVSTASAARAARRRPRTVMYADQQLNSAQLNPPKDGEDKLSFRLVVPTAPGTDSGTATPLGDRSSPFPNGNFVNGDARSLNSYRFYASNADLRSGGTPRRRSVTDAQSVRSTDTMAPPPTSREDKSKVTREYLTLVLSVMYALLLVTLGFIVFIGDPFLPDVSVSPIYCLYLVGVGLLYLLFLLIDLRIYLNRAQRNNKVKEKHLENYENFFRKQEEQMDFSSPDGTKTPQLAPPPPPGLLKPLEHSYCFSHGRHGGSFYLKMGAAAFALGHLVHSVLLLTTQLSYLLEDGYEDCIDYPQVVLDFLYPTYSFIQLFFIFKYSNIIILRWKMASRFGMMHLIGTSICFWVATIVRETVLSLTIYAQSRYGADSNYSSAGTNASMERIDLESLLDENCMGQPTINSIYSDFSLYLFPFTVEYNILIVGIFYIVWDNIGNHASDDDDDISSICSIDTSCKVPTASDQNGYASNFVIHADCHASNRGIFGGIVVVVLTVALLILGFIFSTLDIPEFTEAGHILSDAVKLGLHSVMLVAVVAAYNQTRQLDVNQHPISLLDDILLFICIPAFFMETIFTMVATMAITNIIKSTDVIVMSVQAVVQTVFLVDGLRRCSNSRRLRRVKPGRELVMFLLISNVAMWIFNTFSYKSPDTVDERYEYYGKVLWSILGHVSLPLIMFYRFHSSVCLADIWKSAYEPGSGH